MNQDFRQVGLPSHNFVTLVTNPYGCSERLKDFTGGFMLDTSQINVLNFMIVVDILH